MAGVNFHKIVGIQYTEFLDFLKNKAEKFGTLEVYLDKCTTPSLQSELLLRTASIPIRFDNLKSTAKKYWEDVKKRNTLLRAMAIIMIITVIILLSWFCYYEIKQDLKEGQISKIRMAKSVTTYIIVLLIMVTLLGIFEKNTKSKVDQAKRMASGNDSVIEREFYNFDNLMYINTNVKDCLRLYFYVQRNSKGNIKQLYKQVSTNFPGAFTENNKVVSANIGNLFESVKQDVFAGITSLYYGVPSKSTVNKDQLDPKNGYLNVKKEVISSSAVLMLKEMRGVMKYYYFVAQKDQSDSIQDENDEATRKLIDTFVVETSLKISLLTSPNNGDQLQPSLKSTLIDNSLANPDFKNEFGHLIKSLCYLWYLMYPVYHGLMPDDPAFPINNFVTRVSSNELENDIRNKLNAVIVDRYDQLIAKRQQNIKSDGLAGFSRMLAETYSENFAAYFNIKFQEIAKITQGDYLFIFDIDFMTNTVEDFFSSNAPFNTIKDSSFLNAILDYFSNFVITPQWNEFRSKPPTSLVKARENDFVNQVSSDLATTPIKSITPMRDYIFERIVTKNNERGTPVDVHTLNTYSQLFLAIDKELKIKRVTSGNDFKKETDKESKYISKDEFIDKIDQLSYRSFVTGLNSDYVSYIIDTFYSKISENTQGASMTIYDLFYNRNKNMRLLSFFIAMVITLIIAGLGYFTLNLIEEYTAIKKDHTKALNNLKDPEDRYRENVDHRNRMLIIIMKAVITPIVAILLILIIQSFKKKTETKYNFNKDTLEVNTGDYKRTMGELKSLIQEYTSRVSVEGSSSKMDYAIKDLTEISKKDKEELYNKIIICIDAYEKCNYISESVKSQLPFPYSEITTSVVILILIVFTMVFITMKTAPLQRIKKIKDLNIQLERAKYGLADTGFKKEIDEEFDCQTHELDALMFTIKIIGFIFVVMFLIFYASIIAQSSSEFSNGLYNSVYFEESRCYGE